MPLDDEMTLKPLSRVSHV